MVWRTLVDFCGDVHFGERLGVERALWVEAKVLIYDYEEEEFVQVEHIHFTKILRGLSRRLSKYDMENFLSALESDAVRQYRNMKKRDKPQL